MTEQPPEPEPDDAEEQQVKPKIDFDYLRNIKSLPDNPYMGPKDTYREGEW